VDDAEQEAVAAQLAEMREHLLRDAAVAGTPADAVNAAVDEVAAGYADAQVASFIGVLVEREVRARLQLRPNLETAALGEPDAERSSVD
jgi:hypothetical protein